MLTDENEIRKVLHGTVWDSNLDPYDLYLIAIGKKEPKKWLDKEWVLARFFKVLSWYELLDLFGADYLRINFTPELGKRLWPKGLRDMYETYRRILHGEAPSSSGWSAENQERLKSIALPDRRYGAQ